MSKISQDEIGKRFHVLISQEKMAAVDLPEEIWMNEVALKMSLSDIVRLCRTDTRFASLCDQDLFWKLLTKRDFPDEIPFNPGLPWHQY